MEQQAQLRDGMIISRLIAFTVLRNAQFLAAPIIVNYQLFLLVCFYMDISFEVEFVTRHLVFVCLKFCACMPKDD